MKTSLFFFLFSIFMINDLQADELFLSINLVEIENSKDSNEIQYQVIIEDNTVDYQIHKTGRVLSDTGDIKESFVLDNERYNQLITILDDSIFKEDVDESNPINLLGNAIKLEVRLERNTNSFQFNVSGMTRIMRTRESNIEHLHLYHRIRSIVMLLQGGKSGLR